MGRRYYCDYCNRAFPDSADNRKKHLNGVQHQRLRKLHYDAFRDAATTLEEEMAKKPCKRYLQTGFCDYGPSCRFSHLTHEKIQELMQQVSADKLMRSRGKRKATAFKEPNLELWLSRRRKVGRKEDSELSKIEDLLDTENWTLPEELRGLKLPPSLKPPQLKDLLENDIEEWG